MSIDNRVLEQRLITKDSVIGLSSSLTKCAVKLLGFAPDKDLIVSNTGLESFVREMMVYELELKKSCRLLLASDSFAHEYDGIEQTIRSKMEETKREIAQLEVDLQHAQEIRKHRFACEAEASNVNKLTTVSTLKRRIDEVEENVKECEETTMTVEAQIATRKEHFRQLEHLLGELERPLDGDEKQGGADEMDEENHDDSGPRGGGGGGNDRSSKKQTALISIANEFTNDSVMQVNEEDS